MLKETAEFEDEVSLFAESSEDEGFVDWRDLCSDDVVVPMANGTEVTYKVIHFPAPGEELDDEAANPVLMAESDSDDESASVASYDVLARRASARARWRRRMPSRSYVHVGSESNTEFYLTAESDDENTLIPEADVDGLGRYGGVKPGTYRVYREGATPYTDTNRTDMTTITIDAGTLSGAGVSDAPVRVWEAGTSEPVPEPADRDDSGTSSGTKQGSTAGSGTGGTTASNSTAGSGGSTTGSRSSGTGSNTTAGKTATSGSTMTPRTADASLPAAVSAGLAIAGTAALAYSRRRSRNERGESGKL